MYEYVNSAGDTINILGTGELQYGNTKGLYNSLVFHIEFGDLSSFDLINLINYIKSIEEKYVIIVNIVHTSSYALPEVCKGIMQSDVADYISNNVYTEVFGTSNEYVANDKLSWKQLFNDILAKNPKFIKYGLNFLCPSIYSAEPVKINGITYPGMFTEGGSNDNWYPNSYYFAANHSEETPVDLELGNTDSLDFYNPTDNGIVDFLNVALREYSPKTEVPYSSTLGGYISWSNYDHGITDKK